MSSPQRLASEAVGVIVLALVLGCGGQGQAPETPAQDCRGGKSWHDEDAQRFVGCKVIVGDLKLGGALQTATAFRSLTEVQGSLEIGPSYQLRNLSGLSSLQRVNGDLLVVNTQSLSGVFFPQLREVGGGLTIRGNLSLQTASLHGLWGVGSDIKVDLNHELERLDLSALTEVGGQSVIHGRKLQSIVGAPIKDWQKAPTKPAMPSRVY